MAPMPGGRRPIATPIARRHLAGLALSGLIAAPAIRGARAERPRDLYAGPLPPPQPMQGRVTALRVADFHRGHGINVHLQNSRDYEDFEGRVRPALAELGVGRIRASLPDRPAPIGWVNTLHERHGITLLSHAGANDFPAATCIAIARKLVPGAVDGFEGSNEIDGWYQGFMRRQNRDGDAEAVRWQRELRAARDADPRFAGLPIGAPTVIDFRQSWRIAGSIPFNDRGTFHPYPGGRPPWLRGQGAPLARGGETLRYGSLRYGATYAANPLAPGRSFWATELGYNTDPTGLDEGNHPCPEDIAALYMTGYGAYCLKNGLERWYFYELLDEPLSRGRSNEAYFGLVRGDGSRKPGFHALRNTLALLRDDGREASGFTPAMLDLALSGDLSNPWAEEVTDGVVTCLLQDSAGTFFYGMQLGAPLYDVVAKRRLEPPRPRQITVSVAGGMEAVALGDALRDGSWREDGVTLSDGARGRQAALEVGPGMRWLRFRRAG
ncbi:hypothetical protein [Roseomonas mucosa]|uniref:hypothetical protein n=2 Tax=Roseomonas mucosa TaxID=207340 RepID=UPI00223FAB55|nr:hypothetical protein [Roseomonas mucosa]MDT8355860.1 hypothetical protein [Roseomonas mucosa]